MIQIRRIRRTTDLGIFGLQLELGGEDDRLVEVGVAVGEAQVVALADLDLVGGVEHRGAADELADRTLAAAGIAAQGAADRAGDARQDLQPAPGRPAPNARSRPSAARPHRPRPRCRGRSTSEKNGLSRWITRASMPSSRTRTFEPAAQDLERRSPRSRHRFKSATNSSTWRGLREIRRRPAQAKPGQGRQRLVLLDDVREVVERVHRLWFPPRSGERSLRELRGDHRALLHATLKNGG